MATGVSEASCQGQLKLRILLVIANGCVRPPACLHRLRAAHKYVIHHSVLPHLGFFIHWQLDCVMTRSTSH